MSCAFPGSVSACAEAVLNSCDAVGTQEHQILEPAYSKPSSDTAFALCGSIHDPKVQNEIIMTQSNAGKSMPDKNATLPPVGFRRATLFNNSVVAANNVAESICRKKSMPLNSRNHASKVTSCHMSGARLAIMPTTLLGAASASPGGTDAKFNVAEGLLEDLPCLRTPNGVQFASPTDASAINLSEVKGQNKITSLRVVDTHRVPLAVDSENDALMNIPYSIEGETFEVPLMCPDDYLIGKNKYWCPGKPLRIAYVTWNMFGRLPRMGELSSFCILPNAHLVVVGTQENGSFCGRKRAHTRWVKNIAARCLSNQYTLVGEKHLWAIHIVVFARSRDVAKYVSHVHGACVGTGFFCGAGGNKGGVGMGLALSMVPQASLFSTPLSPEQPLATSTLLGATTSFQARDSDARRRSCDVPPELFPSTLTASNSARALASDHGNDESASIRVEGHSVGELPTTSVMPILQQSPGSASFCVSSSSASEVQIQPAPHPQASLLLNDDAILRQQSVLTSLENSSLHSISEEDNSSLQMAASPSVLPPTSLPVGKKPTPCGHDVQSPILTLLFITAHLAPHQEAVRNRNKHYKKIVRRLRVGLRGKYAKFFKAVLGKGSRQINAGSDDSTLLDSSTTRTSSYADSDRNRSGNGYGYQNADVDVDAPNVVILKPPPIFTRRATRKKKRRDVTEEFDLTIFGGDLNYRIEGTREAIECIVRNHRNIRSILVNNDQLTLERARGAVFHRFREGALCFRPTYKYEVSVVDGMTMDTYSFSCKKKRIPAYCDRVLFKKRRGSAIKRAKIRLYTDVPNVRTSDHRPVAFVLDIATQAYVNSL